MFIEAVDKSSRCDSDSGRGSLSDAGSCNSTDTLELPRHHNQISRLKSLPRTCLSRQPHSSTCGVATGSGTLKHRESVDHEVATQEEFSASSSDEAPSRNQSRCCISQEFLSMQGSSSDEPQDQDMLQSSGLHCAGGVQGSLSELRGHIRKKALKMNEIAVSQRFSTALTSINEIPEQVEQVLQQSATTVIHKAQDEVAVMQDILSDGDAGEDANLTTEGAAQKIADIPELVMNSFESSFAKAMSAVRIRVGDVIQGLEVSYGNSVDSTLVVQLMQTIPEKIRQIIGDAIEEAVKDSQEHVANAVAQASRSFREAAVSADMLDATAVAQRIVANVPQALPQAAAVAAETNVEQAVAAVQQPSKVEKVVANMVVSDALLRAKAGNDVGFSNPGSTGHPELCARPCALYAQGKCENGNVCAFCHAPHPKRPTQLDKRNREMLQRLDLDDRFALMCPILRAKFSNIGRLTYAELVKQLDTLCVARKPEPVERRDLRGLQTAMQSMSARSLLALLRRAPVCKDSAKHLAIQRFIQQCISYQSGQ